MEKALLWQVAVSQASRSLFQKFQVDYVQIPAQKSRIQCFRPDGLVMGTDAPIMRQDAHQCREASNSSRLHPSGLHGWKIDDFYFNLVCVHNVLTK
jgi:hypothetical protein